MTIGFRIAPVTQRVAPELCARAAKLPAANIGDVMNRIQTMRGGFRPFGGRKVIAGPAFTVKARAGDNLLLHRACDMAAPGDIIVGDGAGDLSIALMGELMIGHALKRGVQGIVLDGAVRDVDALAAMDIGVWACGATPSGPYKDGPGEIGVAIGIDGMVIEPGDLMIGDEDGVLCVPIAEAEAVLKATQAKHAAEDKQMEATLAGTSDRAWVDATLKRLGVI